MNENEYFDCRLVNDAREPVTGFANVESGSKTDAAREYCLKLFCDGAYAFEDGDPVIVEVSVDNEIGSTLFEVCPYMEMGFDVEEISEEDA